MTPNKDFTTTPPMGNGPGEIPPRVKKGGTRPQAAPEPGQLPPQALDIEVILLGEMIQFPQIIDNIVDICQPLDMYAPKHQDICQAIYDLWETDSAIDLLIVTQKLRQAGTLDQIGGPYYITSLLAQATSPEKAVTHAYIIKEKSVQRQFIAYGDHITRLAYAPDTDIEDLLAASGTGLDQINDVIFKAQGNDSFQTIIENSVNDYYARKLRAQEGGLTGIRTPLHKLNLVTSGWQPGDLIIIAARPSMGKTAAAVQIAVTAAKDGHYVDFYTLEMTAEQLTARVMACNEIIEIEGFRAGNMSQENELKMEAMIKSLKDQNINLDDRSGITAEYIKAKSSARHRKSNCDFIVVDYLQLMAYDKRMNPSDGIGSITRKLKALAKQLHIPIIVVSQLNRETEGKGTSRRPTMSALRSSGEIEQDADMIIFPFREYYYSGLDEEKNNIDFIIAKNRNGRTGTIEATVNDTITKITDYENNPEQKIPEQEKFPF